MAIAQRCGSTTSEQCDLLLDIRASIDDLAKILNDHPDEPLSDTDGDSDNDSSDGDETTPTMPDEYELELRTDGSRIEYELEVDADDGGTIVPVSGTTGVRTGDYYDSETPHIAGGGIDETDLFDRYAVDGKLVRLAITNDAEDALTLLADGEEVNREDLLPDSSEDDERDDGQQPDFGSPDEPRRFYVYGDDWQGEDESPIYYSAATDGEFVRKDKSDRFDAIIPLDQGEMVVGSIPANNDDAFGLIGEITWVHGRHDRLNFQLNKLPYEPPRLTESPLGGRETPAEEDRPANGDESDSESGSDGGSDSGSDGGSDADLPDWADGEVTIAVDEAAERRRDYRLMASGRLEPVGSDDTYNVGQYGVAISSVWPDNTDSFVYSGRIMQVRCSPSLITEGRQRPDIDSEPNLFRSGDGEIIGDYRDSHTRLLVDGKRRNHEFFDPLPVDADAQSDMDLPYGRCSFGTGGLPSDLAVDTDDVDMWIDDINDLISAIDDADDRDVLGIRGNVQLPTGDTKPSVHIDTRGITLAGFIHDGENPRLSFDRQINRDDDGKWGHCAIQFTEPFWSIINCEVAGPGTDEYPYTGADSDIPPNRDGRYQMRGVEGNFDGRYGAVVNCEIHGFSMINISDRADAMTVLATDSYAPWPSGAAYCIGAGGPIDGTDADHWSLDELQTRTPFWRQTDVNRVLLDGGRHEIEQGTNGAIAPSRFIIGHRAAGGYKIDAHRPGNVCWHAGAIGAVMPNDYGGSGLWLRGRSYPGWRATKLCIPWGEEPDMDDRYPDPDSPLVQVNSAGYEDKDYPELKGEWTRRHLMEYDSSSEINIDWPDPDGRVREMGFHNLELVDCAIGENADPGDVDDELAYYYEEFYDNIGEASDIYYS